MVNRRMLYFHWTTNLVHQAMHTAGTLDIYDMIHIINMLEVSKLKLCII